ncbi:hypothetical protein EMM73_19645 [Rheinheimera sediminis]|uniref:hypothetical protein n=1 Tax=Rheinheimera sp. YQF-1 TaxID=2499626 RepID=UPI000FD9ABEF|nr:hypothetical protein [Rheinheimera sp. YQF-1]RVT40510.1 hypothetical protein EMM73_19645 [Rheinheimera sp. YQF-1]
MIWLFLSGLLTADMPAKEYDKCLHTLQTSGMIWTVVTPGNIHCFEHRAATDSDYAIMMARYYSSSPNKKKDKAIAYYEQVVKMNDQSRGLLEYFNYIVNDLECKNVSRCLKYSYLLEQAYNIPDNTSVLAADKLTYIYKLAGEPEKSKEWRYKSKKKCSKYAMLDAMENAGSVEERYFWRFMFNVSRSDDSKKDIYAQLAQEKNFDWQKFIGFSSEFVCDLKVPANY